MLDHLDHLVLTVEDIDTTCSFYVRVLGMREIVFGAGRRALVFGEQKINLHERGKESVSAADKVLRRVYWNSVRIECMQIVSGDPLSERLVEQGDILYERNRI